MSSFYIKPDKINAVGTTMDGISKELRQIRSEIETVKNSLDLSTGSTEFLKTALTKIENSLDKEASGSNNIGNALRETVQLYDKADKVLAGMEIEDNKDALELARSFFDVLRRWIIALLELIGIITGGSNEESAYVGDPVNVCTGNYVSDIQEIHFPGQPALSFVRHYNSLYLQEGPMGPGWSHNYEVSLELGEGILDLTMGDGWKERFTLGEGGIYTSRHNRFHCIALEEGEEKAERTYIYVNEKGTIYHFNAAGRVTQMRMNNGRGISFFYENGRLSKAVDTGNRSLLYSYDDQENLIRVEDHTGRKVSMEYMSGKLTRVISADGRKKDYKYDMAARLESITDNAGRMIIWNAYDDQNRVVLQRLPNDTTMSYTYEGETVTVTDRSGAETTYRHNERFQVTDITQADGSKRYVYDDNNRRIGVITPEGAEYRREYDDKGNVIGLCDPMGNRIELQYARKGLPSQIREKDGGICRIEYDENGNIISREDALGGMTVFEYDEGLLVKVIHPDLSEVVFTRDKNGYIINRTDEEGRCTAYSYDDAGRMVQRTDPGNLIWKYDYDPCDRMLCVENPAGDKREYTYSETGKIASIKDFDGTMRQWSYNEMDLVSSYVDQNGTLTAYSYDENDNLSEILLPNGGKITHTYDGYNRRIATVDELGLKTIYAYDAEGRLIRETTGEFTKSLEYDACGRIVRVCEKDGSVSSVERDAMGHVTRLIRADGGKFSYTYDQLGRCIQRTDAAGAVTHYSYDKMNRLVKITGAGMPLRQYSYYADGKLKSVCMADGATRAYTYDEAGNLIRIESGTGYTVSYTYDCLRRKTSMEDSVGRKAAYHYDAAGRVTEHVDGLGNTDRYVYSATGKLLLAEDAVGNMAQYEYDEMDRLSVILQGEGEDTRSTTFERNARGQLTQILDTAGNAERYTYNEYGQMILRETPESVCTNYSYDPLGRVNGIVYGDGRQVKMQYDAMGRMTGMEDWNGRMQVEYDAMGRPCSIIDISGNTIRYGWDEAGRRAYICYPDGKKIHYHYNSGKLDEIRTDAGSIQYSYDRHGRLLVKKSALGSQTYTYTPDGRISEILYSDQDGEHTRLFLEYDMSGNISQKKVLLLRENIEKKYTYEYDAAGRITAVYEDGTLSRAYGYDLFGNRIYEKNQGKETISTYNRLNQLIRQTARQSGTGDPADTVLWTYNKDGHAVTRQENNTSIIMKYDAAGKLTEAVDADGSGTVYSYDGLGMRCAQAQMSGSGVKTDRKIFTYDFAQAHMPLMYSEENGNGTDYIHDREITAALHGDILDYYQCDQQGSVLRYLPGEGSTGEYQYDEFGRDLLGTAGQGQPFGFTGLLYDHALKSWQTPARTYSPLTGRFLQRDEERYIHIGTPQSINLYAYCLNNPLLYVDPDGTDCYYFYLPEWENEALADQQMLADQYGYGLDQVHLIPITDNQAMIDGWNGMGTVDGRTVDIDTVVINSHANPYGLGGNTNAFDFDTGDIANLDNQSMEQLILYGCNAGHLDYQDENVANAFSQRVDGAPVLASDGSVSMRGADGRYGSLDSPAFYDWVDLAGSGRTVNEGWHVYQQVDGETVVISTGMFAATVVQMMDSLRSYTVKENAE